MARTKEVSPANRPAQDVIDAAAKHAARIQEIERDLDKYAAAVSKGGLSEDQIREGDAWAAELTDELEKLTGAGENVAQEFYKIAEGEILRVKIEGLEYHPDNLGGDGAVQTCARVTLVDGSSRLIGLPWGLLHLSRYAPGTVVTIRSYGKVQHPTKTGATIHRFKTFPPPPLPAKDRLPVLSDCRIEADRTTKAVARRVEEPPPPTDADAPPPSRRAPWEDR